MFMLYYKSEIRMFVCVVNRREGRGGEGGERSEFLILKIENNIARQV